MEKINDIVNKLNIASSAIKDAFKLSYDCYMKNPQLKNEIVGHWGVYINSFLKYTVEISESGRNNELSKAITKALMFGKR